MFPPSCMFCTANDIAPTQTKEHSLHKAHNQKCVENMLILRSLKSKLMDWAVLQQQSIDFQYGTKTVRKQL